MQTQATASKSAARRHRPKTLTVFAAAFAAGAVLAYGVDRMVDVHVVRVEPQVESEPIFVALRSLPQGSPVTVWDVALKDWPKAMLPTTALKADASFEGLVLRHPVREGQPLLSVQLVRDGGMLPGAAVAALPVATGSADARVSPPAKAPGATVGEPFVPAAPAEPPVTTAAAASLPPTVHASEPAPASLPAAEPAAATVTELVPLADPAPAEPAAGRPSQDDAPAIVAVVQPRSTDVDEAVVAPAGAPAASTTAAVPTPAEPHAAEVVVAATVPVQPLVDAPAPAPSAMADAGEAPLAPPVPALPPTDIERSLAAFAPARVDPVHAPAAPGGGPAAPAEQTASVLDRTTEAEPPTMAQAAPKNHLVVPERVALAVDASFAQPRAETAVQAEPAAQAELAAQAEPAAQARPAARGGPRAATAPQGRATSRKPTSANPATRKQPGPRQPATKTQPPQGRSVSAWLPPFLGGTQQSGPSRQR